MASDAKKVQTLINRAAQVAQSLIKGADQLDALQALYVSHSVDPTGTPLEGNVGAVGNWAANIRTIADSAVSTQMIAASVPSHNGNGFN